MCVREYLWTETEYGISENNAEVGIVVFTWVEKKIFWVEALLNGQHYAIKFTLFFLV